MTPIHIADRETNELVRSLAKHRNIGLTAAIKLAVTKQLENDGIPVSQPMPEDLKALAAELDHKLREITREYCQLRVQHGCAKRPGSRVYKMLSDYGPVETLNRLIANKTDRDEKIGLGFLKAINRLELSAEKVALDTHFRALVTNELMSRARRNLDEE